jgi:hypothetical protein
MGRLVAAVAVFVNDSSRLGLQRDLMDRRDQVVGRAHHRRGRAQRRPAVAVAALPGDTSAAANAALDGAP